jgi:exodeoxyribonuclease V alpha subunit
MHNDKAQLELKGQIERITYYNEENGYTIAKMKVQGRTDMVAIVGTLFSVIPGEVVKLSGYWDRHPKYGEQFKIVSYETIMPATVKGIEKYLGSGMIKGIGPVMAKRLVTKFGDETLVVIEDDIERLHDVQGIGEKRIEMIKMAWEEQKDIRDVMVFLQGNGVSPAYAMKIYKQYGKDSVKIVSENPYRLAMDIFGIGFMTADRIAEKLGVPKDSQIRAEAGILYVLHELSDEGHVFYPCDPLIRKCSEILTIEEPGIAFALDAVNSEKKVIIEDRETNEKHVYLTKYHVSECGAAQRFKSLLAFPKQLRLVNIDQAIEWVQKILKISFSEKQIDALRDSINSKVMVITGGPGTGKTTIINAIIKIYQRMGQKVLLAAPTGRAAKRMTEATGHEAKTIHRLLEYSPGSGSFKKNESNTLEADLIIIDEASMVDTILMYHFLKAVPLKATLILVGDVDQLPSVGAGNVLRDIIDSCCFPVVKLKEIFRQSRESMIIVNAHRINSGEMPLFRGGEGYFHDFFFFIIEEPEKVLEKIVYLCKEGVPSRFGYDPLDAIQILTPMHKGIVGVSNLNTELQKELNPGRDELIRGGRIFRAGDKVLQIRNNYDKDVYNGDIGRVREIDRETQEVLVDFDGRLVSYEYAELDEIVLAYAISVHKSQGSEYPVVIMPLLTQHYILLQRNLLYTGITRGKKLVILVGTRKALAIAINNNKPQMRYTMLKERLMSDINR